MPFAGLLVSLSFLFSLCDGKEGKTCYNTKKMNLTNQQMECKACAGWLKYTTNNFKSINEL